MSQMFGHIPEVMFFKEYILVMGKNKYHHDETLRKVLSILRDKGLAMESSKCKFAERKVSYLGHEISDMGIIPKRKLVEAVVNAPSPRNKEELLSGTSRIL